MRVTRPGFSFAEVMFAVVVLGIGFIMVAAIFPVAIQQSKLTVDESTAAGIATTAASFMGQVATEATMPPTDLLNEPAPPEDDIGAVTYGSETLQPGESKTYPGKVVSFHDPRITNTPTPASPLPGAHYLYRSTMWNAVRGNLISSSDPRFAWVPLYRRDRTYRNDTTGALSTDDAAITRIPAPAAQLILIPVQVQNRTSYGTVDVYQSTNPAVVNLQPRPLLANIPETVSGSSTPGTIEFKDVGAGAMPGALGTLSDGAYVVVSNDNLSGQLSGQLNGRIYRLLARRTDLDPNGRVWDLAPGADFRPETIATDPDLDPNTPPVPVTVSQLTDATVLVIGRNFAEGVAMPTSSAEYDGAAQDVAAYATFVKVKAN